MLDFFPGTVQWQVRPKTSDLTREAQQHGQNEANSDSARIARVVLSEANKQSREITKRSQIISANAYLFSKTI